MNRCPPDQESTDWELLCSTIRKTEGEATSVSLSVKNKLVCYVTSPHLLTLVTTTFPYSVLYQFVTKMGSVECSPWLNKGKIINGKAAASTGFVGVYLIE